MTSRVAAVDVGWRCRRDPSHTRRRTSGVGCYECHILANRARAARRREQDRNLTWALLSSDRFADIRLTPAVREYLTAFDAYLEAAKTGLPAEVKSAEQAKAMALERLTDTEPRQWPFAKPSRSNCTG